MSSQVWRSTSGQGSSQAGGRMKCNNKAGKSIKWKKCWWINVSKIDITFSHIPPSIGSSTLFIITIITILLDFQSPIPLVRATWTNVNTSRKTFFLTKQLSIACHFELDSNYEYILIYFIKNGSYQLNWATN
jgi:hypothetical protein